MRAFSKKPGHTDQPSRYGHETKRNETNMANFNRVILVGNLTRDPELRYTPKGMAVCQGAVAINRRWTTEAGEKQEETTFVDWTAWGKTGEVISQYLKKGNPILVEGELRTNSWEDKNTGEKKSKLFVNVSKFDFVGTSKPPAEPESGIPADAHKPTRPQQTGAGEKARAAGKAAVPATEPEQDDIPF